MQIDLQELEEAASVLSTIEHVAAHLRVSPEDLKPHLDIIKQARLRSEHKFLSMLKDMALAGDKQAMAIWSSFIKMDTIPRNVEDTINYTPEDMMKFLEPKE